MKVEYKALGDHALIIQFEQVISEQVQQAIQQWMNALQHNSITGMIELVPTYTNITIYYKPWIISYTELLNKLQELEENLTIERSTVKNIISIPVVYGGEYGPDLEDVASFHNLSTEEVIRLHTDPLYLVHMIGFAPGFPYLGGMSKKIATPRLANPRKKIARGSIGIADEQTGIYSISTPGGWRIIGRTPLSIFNPHAASPSLLKAGDYVQFYPISDQEYDSCKQHNKGGKKYED